MRLSTDFSSRETYTMRCVITLCVLILHVDLSMAQSTGPFYPYGTGDTVNVRSDDGSSSLIVLQQAFIYFVRSYNQVFVNNNGHLTFVQALSRSSHYQFPVNGRQDIIALFWTDIDNRGNGVISYQQFTSVSVLTQATQDINQYFHKLGFSATWVFVAKWDRVAYFSYSNTNVFKIPWISPPLRQVFGHP
ncbi:sushi, nidogen and EGF-like domain-containing protein 1 isoform X2 [Tachysurus fulvidraco]|uniref:sushi, nidogen and EGF-like domain-containing protein 1 isoform X2 n=1 Tax=Tachysurus fulvidraco TaxID=1234273 RepID=UPI001FEFC024|nr:sushi, nidogen and EGF-like domain-containing protein 1 isoform X2 [Tachysurus fulvidraco]